MNPADLQKLLYAKHTLHYWTVQSQRYSSEIVLDARALALKGTFGY